MLRACRQSFHMDAMCMKRSLAPVSRLAASEDFPGDGYVPESCCDELLGCDLPYASPSGRPTMIQFLLCGTRSRIWAAAVE